MKKCAAECDAGRTWYNRSWKGFRKLKLFGHLCRMKDNRLVKEVMFGIKEERQGEEDRAENGWTTSRSGAEKKSHTQQEGAGSRHVEDDGEDRIGHIWVLSP